MAIRKKYPAKRPKKIVYRKRKPQGRAAPKRRVGKPKRVFLDDNANELKVNKYVGGRKPQQNLKGAWKLLKANIGRNIYAIEYVNRMMSAAANVPPGNLNIGLMYSGSPAGTGQMTLPLFLTSLSAAPNMNNGNVVPATPVFVLQRASTSGQMYFLNLSGSYTPIDTVGSTGNQSSYPGQSDILSSVAIKLLLYGCTHRATKYRIDLVQITEPYLHPDFINQVNGTNGLPANEGNAAIEFYDELTREYTFSPATFHNGNATKRRIKYLKTWYHVFQPKLTNEIATIVDDYAGTSSTIPHAHSFNIFHRFNRSQKYDWEEGTSTSEPTGNTNVDTVGTTVGFNRTDTTFKARVFLMVRAVAAAPTVNGAWHSTVTPSFDMSIRTYHQTLA